MRIRDEDISCNRASSVTSIPRVVCAKNRYHCRSKSLVTCLCSSRLCESGKRFASIADTNGTCPSDASAPQLPCWSVAQGYERTTSAFITVRNLSFNCLLRFLPSIATHYPYVSRNGPQEIMGQDFDARVDVIPVSDPNIFSQSQRIIGSRAFVMVQSTLRYTSTGTYECTGGCILRWASMT